MKPLTRYSQFYRQIRAGDIIYLHAKQSWYETVLEGKFDFFNLLEEVANQHGFRMQILLSQTRLSQRVLRNQNLHILVGDTPAYGRNILHAMPSYIWGFWYLDELGLNANSSIRFADFQSELIAKDQATMFFNRVVGENLHTNRSKFEQAAQHELPPKHAGIYLQDIDRYKNRTHFLDSIEMIDGVARGIGDGLAYVKLHPAQSKQRKMEITRAIDQHPNLEITDASIHDISAAVDIVVTQNSAAGFEALLQRKPVITCAKSDFHHATITVQTCKELEQALKNAPQHMAHFDYDAYITWFLKHNCLEPQSPDFQTRVWHRICQKMFW